METFTKTTTSARAAAWEVAGLRWLAGADIIPVVRVVSQDGPKVTLEQLTARSANPDAAEAFGFQLARMHDAGASAFGVGPDGWQGDGFLGPSNDLTPLPLKASDSWGAYYADSCLLPTAKLAMQRGALGDDVAALLARVCERLYAGEFDDDHGPARIHGDLWSGNVMYTARGATLLDPAAHGGHRETDLAMLRLFGCPYLDIVVQGYQASHPLADGWGDRVELHQLHHLLVHCACFGRPYAARTLAALRRYA